MRQVRIAGLMVGLFATAFVVAPAHAQATRTWVSGVGDDVNPCSRTAPCKTFAGAISKTFINGEINCLDPAGYGAVTIVKSITIDCSGQLGSILAAGTTGININIAVNANDPLRTVRLRGISINGTGPSGTVGTRTGIRGINIIAGSAVFIEDLIISDFSQQGILNGLSPNAGAAKVFVRNSILRNNAGAGMTSAGAATSIAVIEGSHLTGNAFGVATATGNNVTVRNSVLSGNTTAGVQADGGAQVHATSNVVSNNTTGISATGTVRLADNDISFNTTGISGAGAVSFGTNRISGNSVAGTAPTAAGGATNALGQQ